MKVILALSSYKSTKYVAGRLSKAKDVVGIIFERPRTKKEIISRWMKRAKKRGVIKLFDEVIFRVFDSLAQKQDLLDSDPDSIYPESIPKCYVKSVNDEEAVKFMKDLKPDVLVVYGTSILKKDVIGIPSKGVLNIHPGITPEYRGLDPIFWAIKNKEFDKIGVTIHFIDEGIDTGKIVKQSTVNVESNDSYESLFVKVLKKGVDLMIESLTLMENNQISTFEKSEAVSKLYQRPGISNYFGFRRGLKEISRVIKDEKFKIRKVLIEQRNSMSDEKVLEKSAKIVENIKNSDSFKKANKVMIYSETGNEVKLSSLLNEKKEFYLPKIIYEKIMPVKFEGSDKLMVNKFNIKEPVGNETSDQIEICLVPGVGFDEKGNRIGYGKGFYDKFLREFKGLKIGVCYDFQLVKEIPSNDHDIKMDFVITEEKIYENRR